MKERGLARLMVASVCTAGAIALATLVYGVLMGYPGLVSKVLAQETDITVLEIAQEVLAKNQRVIDESVRDLKADSEWTQLKLDALLEEMNVTKRIPRPKLKPTELEEVE